MMARGAARTAEFELARLQKMCQLNGLSRTKQDCTHRTVKFWYGEVEHVHASVFSDWATTNRELNDESQERYALSHQHCDV
jgi:hypothetical protein